jgi:hypothetical protein
MRSCHLMEHKAPRRATADRKPNTLDLIEQERLQRLQKQGARQQPAQPTNLDLEDL